jgi:four helix bundle protein
MSENIRSFKELRVFQAAFAAAMEVFEISKNFPKSETFALTDQLRRSSRSICNNLAEAWRKRRDEAAFIAKLSDCESEAAETQVSLAFAEACGYIDTPTRARIESEYEKIIAQLVHMIEHASQWLIR